MSSSFDSHQAYEIIDLLRDIAKCQAMQLDYMSVISHYVSICATRANVEGCSPGVQELLKDSLPDKLTKLLDWTNTKKNMLETELPTFLRGLSRPR